MRIQRKERLRGVERLRIGKEEREIEREGKMGGSINRKREKDRVRKRERERNRRKIKRGGTFKLREKER